VSLPRTHLRVTRRYGADGIAKVFSQFWCQILPPGCVMTLRPTDERRHWIRDCVMMYMMARARDE